MKTSISAFPAETTSGPVPELRNCCNGMQPLCRSNSVSLLCRLQIFFKRHMAQKTKDNNLLQSACLYAASMLATSIDGHGGHPLRTQLLLKALADAAFYSHTYPGMLTRKGNRMMAQAATFHDIGKLAIDPSILQKPGKLSQEEFDLVKTHTTLGRDAILAAQAVIGGTAELQHAIDIIYSHHERWDGSGYPQGLQGEEIPVSARLMAIADVYDALTSERVYKPTFSHKEAARYIIRQSGRQFDPRAVAVFEELQQTFCDICTRYADPP